MKKIIILSILILLCGCNKKLSNIDILKNMNEDEYVIIDVRTKEEYNEQHIVGAINIPYDEINQNEIINRDKAIFVYCKSGNRSEIALNELSSLGYRVYDLGAFNNIDLPKE